MIEEEIAPIIKVKFSAVREATEAFTRKLKAEDYIPQPVPFASPAKWHLGHTSWFFEEFVLKKYKNSYLEYDPQFSFLFNSYYKSVGTMVFRANRGNITRPGVEEVYNYRKHVTNEILELLDSENLSSDLLTVLELGMNHEQQHQELLKTDVKYILGTNPTFPIYDENNLVNDSQKKTDWISIKEGVYGVGHGNDSFCYDNELGHHKTYIQNFEIRSSLVSNQEFLEFIEDDGYNRFELWLDDGWSWIKEENIEKPLYWHQINNEWYSYTFAGLEKLNKDSVLCHISFYEADAFARWKGMRLPTEFEWEVASEKFEWGKRWEWCNSAYLPYPGFSIAPGAIGEYNGKFMINQMVLRGASAATSEGHSRMTYRNFFPPRFQWQFSGIRLAR